MKKIICVLLISIICFNLYACAQSSKDEAETGIFVMDSYFTIRIYGCGRESDAILEECRELLLSLSALFTPALKESDFARINQNGEAGDLSSHTLSLLQTASLMSENTNGAYLPTMGAVQALWEKAGKEGKLPDEKTLSAAVSAAGEGFSLSVDGVCRLGSTAAALDPGGIGKGYAMDVLLAHLLERGVQNALLDAGSSVAAVGNKNGVPFAVSLRNPQTKNGTLGRFPAFGGHLSVSGTYERFVTIGGEKYHHILSPKTGYPAESGCMQAAVLADSGAVADALSTAFLVMGKEKTAAFFADVERVKALGINGACLLSADGELSFFGNFETVFLKTGK